MSSIDKETTKIALFITALIVLAVGGISLALRSDEMLWLVGALPLVAFVLGLT